MTKVTVIMPSLNVAKYIEKCLSSVVSQTLGDIEIIVVDAGSTDGTMEIIKRYAANDTRIRLIHSQKRSYGYQVNLAASMAKGEYIGIVETDDYIEPDMYEVLYDHIQSTDADYIKAGWRGFFARNSAEWSYEDIPCSLVSEQRQVVVWPRENPFLFSSDRYIWSGIYRRDFFCKFKLQETAGAAFQDVGMLFQILHEAKKGIYIREPLYNYRHDNEGASFHNPQGLSYIKSEYDAIRTKIPKLSKKWNYIYYRNMAGHVYGRFFAMATQGVMISDDDATEWLRKELRDAIASGILHKENFDDFSWQSLEKFIDNAQELSIYLQDFFRPLAKAMEKISCRDVVIFGAKRQGSYLNKIFSIAGVKVRAICDNDRSIHRKIIDGAEVLLPREAALLYPDAVYYLTSQRHGEAMQKQLIDLNIDEKDIIKAWQTYLSPKHTLWAMMHYMDKSREAL